MKSVGKFFSKKTIRDVPLEGKTVLVRADYNVPLDKSGAIADDFRIRASLDTLSFLLKQHAKIILISHLGRPDGADPAFSLRPVAERLADLLEQPVTFIDDCIGPNVASTTKKAPRSSVLLLENLRFHDGEEANDPDFAAAIVAATRPDYFVQDGFGVVHRAHASTDAITQCVPSIAGLLLEREVTTILRVSEAPKRPLVAILGGAKVHDKLPLIKRFVDKADQIIIGGAMANTFLAERGYSVGASKYDQDQSAAIKDVYQRATQKVGERYLDNFLVLPTDVAVAKSATSDATRTTALVDDVAADDMILDIGEQTMERIEAAIDRAQTVIWNGTLGLAELRQFSHGSARTALAIAKRHGKLTSVIGGGDTADFVLHWDAASGKSFTHVSTGGGASLELMSGKTLPGVAALMDC